MTYPFIAQSVKMLDNFSRVLDKAKLYSETKKIDAAVLLNSRLAPDQFPLTRQVQLMCDTAKAFGGKLTAKEPPKHEDTESSIPELQKRIADTIQYLKTLQASDFDGWESRKVTNPRREGKFMVAGDYAMQHAIPNFYFHSTTAYAILRHNGVDVGKKDYLGDLVWHDL